MKFPFLKIQNKYILLASITLFLELLIHLLAYIIDWSNSTGMLFGLLTVVFRIIWLVIIARDSRIFRTAWGYILLYLILPYILGLVARLQHYSWAGIAVTIGLLSISIAYVIRFILKKDKRVLDWIKVIFVFGYFISSYLLLEHYIPQDFYQFRSFLFYMLIFVFAYEKGNKMIDNKEAFSFEESNILKDN